MNRAAVILAGGESRRMGSPKALLPWDGTTFLNSLGERLSKLCSPVIVVLGHEPQRILDSFTPREPARVVINANYHWGQLSSLQAGLREIPENCESILFTPVDYAPVATATLTALAQAPAAPLIYPCYQGHRGHPVVLSRDLAAEILALDPARDEARSVTRRHLDRARLVEVDDPAILNDIDTPEDYRRLTEVAR